MTYLSLAAVLLIPILFALRVIGFARGRRRGTLAWLAVPVAFGAVLLTGDGWVRIAGVWLLVPSVQLSFLYAVAEVFEKLSGRELNNIIVGYIRVEHALDTILCSLVLVLMTLVPSWLLYEAL